MSYFVSSYSHDVSDWGAKRYGYIHPEPEHTVTQVVERSIPQEEPCNCQEHECQHTTKHFGEPFTASVQKEEVAQQNQEVNPFRMTTEYRSRYQALEGEVNLPGNSYNDKTTTFKTQVLEQRPPNRQSEPPMTTLYRASYCK